MGFEAMSSKTITTDEFDRKVDEGEALSWLGKGVQPTDTVRQLLKNAGVWAKFNTKAD